MLLDDEEIESIENIGHNEPDAPNNTEGFEEFWMHEDTLKRIAKAQLKKVVESDKFDYCDSAGDNFTGIGYFISIEDWQSLLEEVNGDVTNR